MPTLLKKLLSLLSRREKRRGALVLIMVVFMALFETAGVASLVPFLSVLGNPALIHENAILHYLYHSLWFTSVNSFLFGLGIGSFLIIVFGALFRVATKFVLHRFTEMRRHSIGARLLETYLRQPYEFFLNRHSSDLAKGILSEVDQLVRTVVTPVFEIIAYSTVSLAIITLLVLVDPWVAIIVGATLSGTYSIIFMGVRGLLGRAGRDRVLANRERFVTAGEALAGIKDIKLLGREYAYLRRFNGSSVRYARHQATNATLSEAPKYLIEAVSFGGMLGLALYLLGTGGNLGNILPLLGVYAFAGLRLLPAAQHIYAGFSNLRFGQAVIDAVYEDLHSHDRRAEIRKSPPAPWMPQQRFGLHNVSFTYPGAQNPALKLLNLEISVGSTVGIIGTTGSGKTTAVDLILGLLRPTSGELQIDGEPVTDANVSAWQVALGYVPQDIYLTDASVAENIAFGISPDLIDFDAVQRSARMAQLHEFIENELPRGYNTLVGERGVRLSGGQRQRIGIARALYHDPAVLIFDEATSALDNTTEASIMEAVGALHGKKTVILIAHRLTTVKQCDRILVLEQGQLIKECLPSELNITAGSKKQISYSAY